MKDSYLKLSTRLKFACYPVYDYNNTPYIYCWDDLTLIFILKKPDIPYEIKHLYPTTLDIHGALLREFIHYGCENYQVSFNDIFLPL